MIKHILIAALVALGAPAAAQSLSAPFASIDGGQISLGDYAGGPVLLVNTASQCAYTKQYSDLQALYDRYRDRGLVVLAVPSDDFNQELSDNAQVKEFCEIQYGIDMPMTEITKIKGKAAHPVYAALKSETGFVPRWNFNKVLISGEGEVVATYRARVQPLSDDITQPIEELLTK